MKRPQMVLIDDLSIANGASSLEFLEHQPCLLLKRHETLFFIFRSTGGFPKNEPTGWVHFDPRYHESQKLKQRCIRIHQQSCQSSASKIFQSSFLHVSDVWQVCTTVLDFLFAKNIDQETAHKDIQRHQAPETSMRWIGSIIEIFKMF